jgi:TRAP-type C4-dicarboxylate transport system substrate-binding protein
MRNHLLLVVAVMVISALVLGGCAAQPAPAPKPTPSPTPVPSPTPAQVIQLKLGHHNPPNGRTTVKYINVWAQKVEAATNGRVKITLFPAESLFKSMEAIEATNGGIADIAWSQVGNFPGRFDLTNVLALPFLSLESGKIDGKPRSGAAVNSHIVQELYETTPEIQAEWKDVKLLFVHASDPFVLFTSKKQIKNQNDLKGLKIRDLSGPPSDMWKLLGAVPALLAAPDIYEAVDKGVLDGNSCPWAMMATYKLYEVLKYQSVGTCSGEYFMMMNNDKFNSLPADIQKAITSVSGIAGAEFGGDSGWGDEVSQELLATAQKAGKPIEKIALDAGELDKWKEIAGKPIWNDWVAKMKAKNLNGQKVIDAAQVLLKKYAP